MHLRLATENDLNEIGQLFYETINVINRKDYNDEQIKVWSSKNMASWKKALKEQHFILAEFKNQILGFSSLTNSGHLDFIYVHKEHQRKGIARSLLKEMEKHAMNLGLKEISSEVSITAKPFFISQGFISVNEQEKFLNNTMFINYVMKKFLTQKIKPS